MIEVNGTVKPILKKYYEIINGVAYNNQLNEVINKYAWGTNNYTK